MAGILNVYFLLNAHSFSLLLLSLNLLPFFITLFNVV